METSRSSGKEKQNGADDLKLAQITKLFLNSFKKPQLAGASTKSNNNSIVEEISDSTDAEQEAKLESAFKTSSTYLIAKS